MEDLIDRGQVQKALGLKGTFGRFAANALYRVLGMVPVNRKWHQIGRFEGPEFSSEILKVMGVGYDLDPAQLDNIPAEGGFITISNHHYGAADGLILNAIVGSRRPDFKILTTFFLSCIPSLKDCFIPVDNFATGGARSVSGIRQALGHIAQGRPLGLFPAGEVATWQKKGQRTAVGGKRVVEDKPWPDNIIRLIRKSGLAVIPVYFDGENSRLFHILGRIHPMLRTLRLVKELVNKKGKTIKVRFGKAIPAEDIAAMDFDALGGYLRSRCYALEAQCTAPAGKASAGVQAPLDTPVEPALVREQMEAVQDKIIFSNGDYRGYLLDASDAPDAMRELYRLREETFRAIGEGTGKPSDTDEYDSYYKHLVLWNVPNGELVGSYRYGYAPDIIDSRGLDALYTASLVRYGPAAPGILVSGMELGRSFIATKYQREVLPLKLLLTGLAVAAAKHPKVESYFGTVSISDAIPDFYKSLLVSFIERDFPMPEGDGFAVAPMPFKKDFLRVNPDSLLGAIPKGNIDALDRLILTLSDGKCRLPVLFRKYFNCGAKAACFNVDPLFGNSLDALILLQLKDFPQNMFRSITRPLPKEEQEAIAAHFYSR